MKLTIAAIAISVLLCFTAAAADIDYSGAINGITGAPITDSNVNSEQNSRVSISDGVFYDRDERMFVIVVNGREIVSTVVDGMIVNDTVQIFPDESLEVYIYRDGEMLDRGEMVELRKVGNYVLEVKNSNGQYNRVLTFTIVGRKTGLVTGYTMPTGFTITDVSLTVKNDKGKEVDTVATYDRNFVSLMTEGNYTIDYLCAMSGVNYSLDVYIDHTAPTLALEGVVNGLAKGPVRIDDLEDGCGIAITLNGGRYSYTDVLTRSGDYVIVVADDAGNTTTYNFTILVYFDSNSILFFAIVIVIVIATVIFLLTERKRLRVR